MPFVRFALFLSALCLCFTLSAQQQVIDGYLLDKKSQQPIRGVSISLKSEEGRIVAFKISDVKGYFQLSTTKNLSNTYLEVNHISYKKFRAPLPSALQNIKIELEQSTTQIEEVEVKSRPLIRRQGDTLSYNVEGFARDEDRSIGDVLKRLPGIEVSDAGQIKYQGKAISNFYIDGDDLLDDKYAIGTRTIPHKMVQDIQVLNRHEHLKVLKGKRYTDNVALNLVIKDDAKLKMTGQAKLGTGLPKQYDGEINSILFNKKVKMLNVLYGNNTGRDLSGDFRGSDQTVLSKMGSSAINNMLSLGTVGAPPVDKAHYYMNNSASIQLNNLVNTRKNWQLKSNVQLLYDKNSRNFNGSRAYFSDGQTFAFDENQHAQIDEWLAALRLSAEKNVDNRYIKNALSLEYEKENGQSDIWGNTGYTYNARQHKVKGFSNNLSYVPALTNGDLLQVDWYTNYANKPQTLRSSTDAFDAVFATSPTFDHILQHIKVPNFFTQASVGYRLPKGTIFQSYTIGTSVEYQRMLSDILLMDNGTTFAPDRDSTINDMQWLRSSVFANANYEWKKKRFSSSLTLPLSVQRTSFEDNNYRLSQQVDHLIFNPTFDASYSIGYDDEVSFAYSRSNGFGNIENVYRGLIFQNYRTLSNNASGINESRSNNFNLGYKLGSTLKMMFFNFNLAYNQSISSTMLSNIVSSEATQIQLIEQENKVNSYNASVGFDKFIFAWASGLKMRAGWSRSDYNQLFNQETLPFVNTSYTLGPSLEARIFRTLNVSYSSQLLWAVTRQRGTTQELDRDVFNISQNIGFPTNLFDKTLHLHFKARHLFSHQPGMQDMSYVFFDTFARYRHKKWKTDLELNLSNIGNIKKFETYSISANMQSQNLYELRGRMAIVKVVFNFM